MLKSVKVTNHRDETLEMILANPEISEFIIESIDGLGPEKTNINSTENQIYDGSSFDSAVTGVKNIVFHLKFWPSDWDVERVRHKSYQYFQNKKFVKLEFNTDKKTTYIEGYVESNEPAIFEEFEGCDISILCMEPYFKLNTDNQNVIKGIDKNFTFPFSNNSITERLLVMSYYRSNSNYNVYYSGNIETGVKIELELSEDSNSIIVLRNTTYNQIIEIDLSKIKNKYNITLNEGDYLFIDTTTNNKSITLFTPNDPNETERNADIGLNITNVEWIELNNGYNNIDINNINIIKKFTINNRVLYGGV